MLLAAGVANAQVRGVYPAGMNAVGAGSAPAPGWAYSNLSIYNERDERVGPDGETLATGQQAVFLNLNTLAWGSEGAVLGPARFGATATVILSLARQSGRSDRARADGASIRMCMG